MLLQKQAACNGMQSSLSCWKMLENTGFNQMMTSYTLESTWAAYEMQPPASHGHLNQWVQRRPLCLQ